jgi:hypothetical protein
MRSRTCDAFLVDLDGDGATEILVVDGQIRIVTARHPDARWGVVGTLGSIGRCPGFAEAMRRQDFRVVPPTSTWRDIEAGGRKLGVIPTPRPAENGC